MKKFVLAALISAVAGVASAQVTLSGKVSEYVDNTKVGTTRGTQLVTEPTSNIAVSVNEALGGGLKVRAVVETSLSGNSIDGVGTKLGDRQTTLGLSNSLGSVDLGRNVHSHFLAITSNDVFDTLYGSVAGDVVNFRGLRLSDGVFVSVKPVKNVSLAVERTAHTAGQDASIYAINGSMYGVDAALARYESGKEKSTTLGLTTKVLGAKVTYVHSDDQGLVKSKGDLLGASYAFGPATAKVSLGKTNTDVKAYAVGADYSLSKRTEISLAYRNVNRPGTVNDVSQVGLGLTHRF